MADIERFSRNVLFDTMYQADCSAAGGIVIFTADWHPILNCDRLVAIVLNCTGAQALSAMTVRGATAVAGTNPLTLCTLTTPANVNLANETGMIEVQLAVLHQRYMAGLGFELTHVNIGVETLAGATPVVGTLIGYNVRTAQLGLTTATEDAWT